MENSKSSAFKSFFNTKRREISLEEFKVIDDTTSSDLLQAKEEILNAFAQFIIAKQHNKIDFNNLSEEYLAILKETELDLGLQTKSSEFYKVEILTKENIFVIYHNISDFEFTRGSSTVKLRNGRSERIRWSESPKVEFSFLDINIDKAVQNLSQLTLLNLRGSTEQKENILLEIRESVVSLIRAALQGKNISEMTEDEMYSDELIL